MRMTPKLRRAIIASAIAAGVIPASAALWPSLYLPQAPAIIKPAGFWKPHETKLVQAMPLTMGMLANHEGPPPSYNYRNSYNDLSNLTTYTFAGSDIGVAHSKRLVVIGTHGSSQWVSSMTIGGVNATMIIQSTIAGRNADIWAAVVPTGTTATVSVTYLGACTSAMISVWATYPLSTTPVDAVGGGSNNLSTFMNDVAKTAGGFTIMIGWTSNPTLPVTFTQNGGETIVQRNQTQALGGTITSADHLNTATTTLNDYTHTNSGAGNTGCCIATWGPPPT